MRGKIQLIVLHMDIGYVLHDSKQTPHQPLDIEEHCKYQCFALAGFVQNIFCSGTLVFLADSVALVRAYEASADVLVLPQVCKLTDEEDLHIS